VGHFFVGGRKLNRFVVALSAVVSGRSSWLLLGFTGMAYLRGISAVWAVVGYIVVEFLLFFYYAPRLRRFSEHYDTVTLPDFFADRLKDKNGTLRMTLIFIFLLFMVSYVSAQFVAGGKTFASSFDISVNGGVLLTAGIVLFYTVVGGFLAVSLTDVVQAFFMLISLVALPILAVFSFGGVDLVVSQLSLLDVAYIDPLSLSAGVMIGFLGIGLGSPGNPHILIRYIAIDDPKQLRFSAYVGTTWNIIMAVGALFIGLVGRAYFPETDLLPGGDPEQIFPVLAEHMLHPIVFGLIIASIFAAIMSTCDSQLLVAASSVSRDFIQKIWKRKIEIPERRLVLISRIVILGLVFLAVILGLLAQDLIFWLVLFAWAGLGASLGPVSILALFWRGLTKNGAIAGILVGMVITVIWYQIPVLKGFVYELIPAFVFSLLTTIIVSRHEHPHAEVTHMFNLMKDRD